MHKLVFSILFGILSLSSSVCRSDFVIASYQPAFDGPQFGFLDSFYTAQTFTTTSSGILSNISVRLSGSGTTPSAYVFDIRSVAGGVPSTSFGTVTVPSGQLTTTASLITANFDALQLSLNQNTTYAFSVRANAPLVASIHGTANNGYTNGSLYSTTDGTTWSLVGGGLLDSTFTVTAISAVPEPTSIALFGMISAVAAAGFRKRIKLPLSTESDLLC